MATSPAYNTSKEWKPRELISTFRTFVNQYDDDKFGMDYQRDYMTTMKMIKLYGCPVSKVSDGEDWIRVYFDIPADKLQQFLNEEKLTWPNTKVNL